VFLFSYTGSRKRLLLCSSAVFDEKDNFLNRLINSKNILNIHLNDSKKAFEKEEVILHIEILVRRRI
jgi:hypothetical protein